MPQSGVLAHDDETTTEHTERSLSPAMVSQTNLGGNTVDMALPSASPGTGGPIEQKLFVMHLEHRMRTFQGTFHGNPDYALWYGWSEMERDLTEIKFLAKEMRREHASAAPPAPAKKARAAK